MRVPGSLSRIADLGYAGSAATAAPILGLRGWTALNLARRGHSDRRWIKARTRNSARDKGARTGVPGHGCQDRGARTRVPAHG